MNIIPRGKIDASLVIVGDFPGIEDTKTGIAFSGDTGELVSDILRVTGFDIDDVLFVTVSPNRKYGNPQLSPQEIREYSQTHLFPILQSHKRKTIIALGNTVIQALFGTDFKSGVNSIRRHRLTIPSLNGVNVFASLHPYLIQQNPEEIDDVMADFKIAFRAHNGDLEEQVPILIKDIESVNDVDDLITHVKEHGLVSFDFETDRLDCDTVVVISCSFATGCKEEGKYICWFWCGYDRLEPRFSEDTLNAFKLKFLKFFEEERDFFGLIGWNCNFDDWVAETWLGKVLPGSNFDGMIMKWSLNNSGLHNLKDATERYLGYVNYEGVLLKHVQEIKARRNKILNHPDDFRTLKWAGVEPDVSKSGKPKWPSTLDKGFAAYALVPYDILREYNCYDAIYTKLLYDLFFPKIQEAKLGKSCNLRHKIAKDLLRCEQRGFLLDVENNRRISTSLQKIIDTCSTLIAEELKDRWPKDQEFNVNSVQHLTKLLFADPVEIPTIDRPYLYKVFRIYESYKFEKDLRKLETEFYGNYSKIEDSIKTGGYDYSVVDQKLKEFVKAKLNIEDVKTKPRDFYCKGLYRPRFFTATGKPSCSSSVLQELYAQKPNEILKHILMYRKAYKIKSTFVDKVYNARNDENVVKSKYNPCGTNTGRISSSNPINWQNFPEKVRGQFIPRPGYKFVNGDLSQAEVRAIAAFSGDDELINAVDAQDIHRAIAALLWNKPEDEVTAEERRAAKTVVFGIIYGIGPDKLALAIGQTLDEAEAFIYMFFQRFPKVKRWLDKQIEIASTPPYFVHTPWGTRRSTKAIKSISNSMRMHVERVAGNMPIQGSAGELTLWIINKINSYVKKQGWDVHLVNTTHDSFTYEVPIALCEVIEELMVKFVEGTIPIEPLNKVTFRVDTKIQDFWYGEVSIKEAIDPKDNVFDWDLFDMNDSSEESELICQ